MSSIIDVRTSGSTVVFSEIRFADPHPETEVALKVMPYNGCSGGVTVVDEGGDAVVIVDKVHARDLTKALDKAIELGWLK